MGPQGHPLGTFMLWRLTRERNATYADRRCGAKRQCDRALRPPRAGSRWTRPRPVPPCRRQARPRASAAAPPWEKVVRLAQNMQVGPCTLVEIRLEKAEVGPTSGPTLANFWANFPHFGRARLRVRLEGLGAAGQRTRDLSIVDCACEACCCGTRSPLHEHTPRIKIILKVPDGAWSC